VKKILIRFLFVISGLFFAGSAPLASQQPSLLQELGIIGISVQSDHKELPSPRGFGITTSWEFGGSFLTRLSFNRVSGDTRKDGIVCDQYALRINCRTEVTQTSVALSGLRAALMWAPPLWDRVRLGAGGGLSFNQLTTASVGTESGLEADLLAPNAGIIGFTALISAAVTPVSTLPVKLTGGFGVHWVDFSTCSGNDSPRYDPYCGMASFREIELGLSYVF
jgi:hypothetical protein